LKAREKFKHMVPLLPH